LTNRVDAPTFYDRSGQGRENRMRHKFKRPSPAMLVALAALVVALGGTAIAAIPGGDGVIDGCYKTSGGALRVIDKGSGASCTATETAISFNQRGPTGATGPTGAKGVAGAKGPTGPKGTDGQNGSQGPTGPKGATGAKGPTGSAGPKGADGQNGLPGPTGPRGADGPPGPAGPKGWSSTGFGTISSSGDTFVQATSPFTASRDMTCLVTVSGQVNPSTGFSGQAGYYRSAIWINGGAPQNDGQYGHYIVGNGQAGYQPDMSRTAVYTVLAGQSVAFGGYLGLPPSQWYGADFRVSAGYACS
jgi:hypothetical protein